MSGVSGVGVVVGVNGSRGATGDCQVVVALSTLQLSSSLLKTSAAAVSHVGRVGGWVGVLGDGRMMISVAGEVEDVVGAGAFSVVVVDVVASCWVGGVVVAAYPSHMCGW